MYGRRSRAGEEKMGGQHQSEHRRAALSRESPHGHHDVWTHALRSLTCPWIPARLTVPSSFLS